MISVHDTITEHRELLQKSPSQSFMNLVLPENFNIAEKCSTTDFSAKSSVLYWTGPHVYN